VPDPGQRRHHPPPHRPHRHRRPRVHVHQPSRRAPHPRRLVATRPGPTAADRHRHPPPARRHHPDRPARQHLDLFTIASTPRIFDRASGEWKDGDALFLRCTLWRQPAENVAETLTKGSRGIVTGRLRQRSYETREGEKRTVVEEIGPSLRYATARVTAPGKPPPRPPPPAAVNTAATRGPAPAETTNPRSDPARTRSGGGSPGPCRVTPPVGHPGRPGGGVPRWSPRSGPATGWCPAGAARRVAGPRC